MAGQLDLEGDPLKVLELAGQMLGLTSERRDRFREIVEAVIPRDGTLGQGLAVLHEYRESPQLATDSAQAPVKLMSLHGAKGLTADVLVIPSLDDAIVPGDGDVEEQRRLMYVSMTRARKRLYLGHVLFRPGPLELRRRRCPRTGPREAAKPISR